MIIASTIFLKLFVSLRMKTRLSTLCEMRNTSTLWGREPRESQKCVVRLQSTLKETLLQAQSLPKARWLSGSAKH